MTSTRNTSSILDSFEEAWATGLAPNVDDYLIKLRDFGDSDACIGICAADLEWRWKIFYPKLNVLKCFRAEDYLRRLPIQFTEKIHIESLLHAEWLARSRWGDEPTVEEFIASKKTLPVFEDLFCEIANLSLSLVRSLDDIAPLITNVVHGDQRLRFLCPPEYEIGRRRKSDPPAIAWLEPQSRLVVADDGELTVSRKQLIVRRIRISEVELINVSRKVSITIGNERVEPGERARIETPFSIQLLDTQIVVKTG